MPSPWISFPLRGASNQELFFEPGVELVAKKGGFLGKYDALITFRDLLMLSSVGSLDGGESGGELDWMVRI